MIVDCFRKCPALLFNILYSFIYKWDTNCSLHRYIHMLYVKICDVDSFFSTGMASWTDFIGDFRSEFLSFIVDGITEVLMIVDCFRKCPALLFNILYSFIYKWDTNCSLHRYIRVIQVNIYFEYGTAVRHVSISCIICALLRVNVCWNSHFVDIFKKEIKIWSVRNASRDG
jgi:hypothetical protein